MIFVMFGRVEGISVEWGDLNFVIPTLDSIKLFATVDYAVTGTWMPMA